MAIHTKVGILTQVPGTSASVTPGLIDGIYADLLTKEFDFLDDQRMYPQDAWFTNDPYVYTSQATGDWEEIGWKYRYWRDQYFQRENEYWLQRSVRTPFQYQNFTLDPVVGGGNALEWIRVVYPAPNGDFNIPYPNPKWSDGYNYQNSSYPLRHNMTRLTLPLVDMAWQAARASGSEWMLEKQTVRDNQAAIDTKEAEIANIESQKSAAIILMDAKYVELQGLIDSLSDQALIEIAQNEYNALNTQVTELDASLSIANQENNDLYNNSQWVPANTFSRRSEQFRANRDALWKSMNELALGTPLSSQNPPLTEEDLAAKRAAYLDHDFSDNNPNPWNDEVYRFTWGDGINPVPGADNGTIHGNINGDWGQNSMTNHPLGTMPFEVLSNVDKLNVLPAVSNPSLLPATGNPGDIVLVDGEFWAWDPQNQEWSLGFYNRFIGTFDSRIRQIRDAKLKAKNELALAMRPFMFTELHIPAFALSTSGEVVK